MLAFSYFILEVDFAVAHWIFAARYRTIAKEMPIIVQGGSIKSEDKAKDEKQFNKLLILNIIGPSLELAVNIPLNIVVFTQFQTPSTLLTIGAIVFPTFSATLQIISGVVLVRSVLKIKQFYRDKDIEDRLNMPTLLLHSSAFLLYLVSIILYVVIWDFFVVYPDDSQIEDIVIFIFTTEIVISAIA
jgi:hypothetical protein